MAGPENNDSEIGSAGGDMTGCYHLSSDTITQLLQSPNTASLLIILSPRIEFQTYAHDRVVAFLARNYKSWKGVRVAGCERLQNI